MLFRSQSAADLNKLKSQLIAEGAKKNASQIEQIDYELSKRVATKAKAGAEKSVAAPVVKAAAPKAAAATAETKPVVSEAAAPKAAATPAEAKPVASAAATPKTAIEQVAERSPDAQVQAGDGDVKPAKQKLQMGRRMSKSRPEPGQVSLFMKVSTREERLAAAKAMGMTEDELSKAIKEVGAEGKKWVSSGKLQRWVVEQSGAKSTLDYKGLAPDELAKFKKQRFYTPKQAAQAVTREGLPVSSRDIKARSEEHTSESSHT